MNDIFTLQLMQHHNAQLIMIALMTRLALKEPVYLHVVLSLVVLIHSVSQNFIKEFVSVHQAFLEILKLHVQKVNHSHIKCLTSIEE